MHSPFVIITGALTSLVNSRNTLFGCKYVGDFLFDTCSVLKKFIFRYSFHILYLSLSFLYLYSLYSKYYLCNLNLFFFLHIKKKILTDKKCSLKPIVCRLDDESDAMNTGSQSSQPHFFLCIELPYTVSVEC